MRTSYLAGGGSSGSTPVVNQSGLWANRAAFQSNGNIVRFTDVGAGSPAGTGGGTLWIYNSTTGAWKLVNNEAKLDGVDTTNTSVSGDFTEQQLNGNHSPLFASVISLYSEFFVEITASKSAAVQDATIRLRFGPLGTTSDPVIATITDLSATSQGGGYRLGFKRVSATQLQRLGSGNPSDPYSGAFNGTLPAAVTVGNFDSVTQYLTISSQFATGTETVSIISYSLKLMSPDS